MDRLFSNLIRNVTGKTFTYDDSIMAEENEIWFIDAEFGGIKYRVISYSDDTFLRFYVKHPLDQNNIPTRIMRWKLISAF